MNFQFIIFLWHSVIMSLLQGSTTGWSRKCLPRSRLEREPRSGWVEELKDTTATISQAPGLGIIWTPQLNGECLKFHFSTVWYICARFDWHDGEPNNFGHNENCLALREYHDPFFPIVSRIKIINFSLFWTQTFWTSSLSSPSSSSPLRVTLFAQFRDYFWNDMNCDSPHHYICENRCAELW